MLLFTAIITLAVTAALHVQNITAVVIACLALGFAAVGYVPVGLAFGVELTFPMPAATANGSMFMLAQGSGFISSLTINYITDSKNLDDSLTENELLLARQFRTKIAFLFVAFTFFVSLIITCFVTEDLRRMKFTQEEDNQGKSTALNDDFEQAKSN